jgi:hypothetical protein
LKFENHGYAGARVRGHGYAGKRVRVQRVFSKKTLPGPSQTRTRVPVYPPLPGHGYEYRGYGSRVHGYGLYPAGFSIALVPVMYGSLAIHNDEK